MKPIRILVADDHKLVRKGISALLSDEADLNVVGEAECGEDVMKFLDEKSDDVDLVLMDIHMPGMNGIDATKAVTSKFPSIKVLGLSFQIENRYVTKMMEAGAKGYILKNTDREDLINAIKSLHSGNIYFSREISEQMLSKMMSKPDTNKKVSDHELSQREKEVLVLIAEELTNTEIAEQLELSPRTVDTYRRNLLEKLNVKNTAGLVREAMRLGMIR